MRSDGCLDLVRRLEATLARPSPRRASLLTTARPPRRRRAPPSDTRGVESACGRPRFATRRQAQVVRRARLAARPPPRPRALCAARRRLGPVEQRLLTEFGIVDLDDDAAGEVVVVALRRGECVRESSGAYSRERRSNGLREGKSFSHLRGLQIRKRGQMGLQKQERQKDGPCAGKGSP